MNSPGVLVAAEEEYQSYTGLTSSVVRTLALAAVGIVWLYGGDSAAAEVPVGVLQAITAMSWLLTALLAAISVLAIDLLQYSIASLLSGSARNTLVSIMSYDDSSKEEAPERARLAWRSRTGRAFAEHVIYGIGVGHSNDNQDPISRARCLLALLSAQGDEESQSDGNLSRLRLLSRRLEEPWSPPGYQALVGLLFWLKVVGLLVCYASILIGLVGATL